MSAHRSLQRGEARDRARMLTVDSYDVALDFTGDADTFGSRTAIRFTSGGGDTFVDLAPRRVCALTLNGVGVSADDLVDGRLPIRTQPGANELRAEVRMPYRNDGEGVHRSVDPADGRHYLYGMCFMDAAPTIFACFDQPDLKAPFTLHVTAPEGWTVVANGPGEQVGPGRWEFATTPPLATYFVTVVAGPYHLLTDRHDGIDLGLSCRASIAAQLDADAEELFTLTRQCFDELHRLFGIRYPFGKYHQAFVPEFNAGAMENPGCVTFRDPLVFTSRVTRGERILRATTLAHEMAHQWFGNLTTPRWWDDLWLNESFAEYMGNRVTAAVTDYSDAWVNDSYVRRSWGLVADQRPSTHPVAGTAAPDAATALRDFDGISYVKGASLLRQLNATLGDEAFLGGVADHLRDHRFGNATMADLVAAWRRAGGADLDAFVSDWLRSPGLDTLELDRETGVLHRRRPDGAAPRRVHRFRVATWRPGTGWRTEPVRLDGDDTPCAVPADAAVVLDPYEDTWASTWPDPLTQAALPGLLADTPEEALRAGIWNNLRNGFHNAHVDPRDAMAAVERGLPAEPRDEAVRRVAAWARTGVVPLCCDPAGAGRRLHAAALARLATAAPGSTLQLAAFGAAVDTADDPGRLDGWRHGHGLPTGLALDADLRWRILVRLAVLGAVSWPQLDEAFADEPTARTRVDHARAVASLPLARAKAWAWQRFTGETAVPNYELEAAGTGFWRAGQEALTAPYVARYFAELPGTVEVRTGWVLADAAGWFFPITATDAQTLRRARALLAEGRLDSSLRRALDDLTDELARRVTVLERYPCR